MITCSCLLKNPQHLFKFVYIFNVVCCFNLLPKLECTLNHDQTRTSITCWMLTLIFDNNIIYFEKIIVLRLE